MTGFVTDVGSRDETPRDVVKTPLLGVGEVGETVFRETNLRERLFEKRIGEVGGERIKASGSVHGEVVSR